MQVYLKQNAFHDATNKTLSQIYNTSINITKTNISSYTFLQLQPVTTSYTRATRLGREKQISKLNLFVIKRCR